MSKIRILNLLSCLAIGIGAGAFLGGDRIVVAICLMFSCLANVWAFILLPHELYLTKNELMDEMSFYKRENDALFNRYEEFQDQLESVNHKINKIVVDTPKTGNRVKSARKV
jgi:hypothetical protein